MRAIVWTKYGPPDVLQLQEVAKPAPKDDEVLVKIHATSVTAGDCEVRSLTVPRWVRLPLRLYAGVRKPTRVTILGQELAGDIVAVGKDVDRFQAGDRVFGATSLGFGGYAEYTCIPARSADNVLEEMPANLSYEEAASLPVGGLEALHFLQRAKIQRGESILINGAGGGIGTAAIQLARHMGAEVTGVDSTGKLAMLAALGADHVIDYTREDFTSNGPAYDVIFDVVGKGSFSQSIKALKPNGCYLMANPTISTMLQGLWVSKTSSKQVITATTSHRAADLKALKELVEAGILKPVIDRRYPLEQTAEAHRYVESGRKVGTVVITVAENHGR